MIFRVGYPHKRVRSDPSHIKVPCNRRNILSSLGICPRTVAICFRTPRLRIEEFLQVLAILSLRRIQYARAPRSTRFPLRLASRRRILVTAPARFYTWTTMIFRQRASAVSGFPILNMETLRGYSDLIPAAIPSVLTTEKYLSIMVSKGGEVDM